MKIKEKYITKQATKRLYNIDVPIIGLTGGIATGKSTASKILQNKGINIICADTLVKEVYALSESIEFVAKTFPSAIKNNLINFSKLREIAFGNKENINLLEVYIYSKLEQVFIEKYKTLNNSNFIIYDVPLLFEKNIHKSIDLSVCVHCSQEEQIKRVVKRDNISIELAKRIINKQMHINDKINHADLLIDNSKDIHSLKNQIENFILLLSV